MSNIDSHCLVAVIGVNAVYWCFGNFKHSVHIDFGIQSCLPFKTRFREKTMAIHGIRYIKYNVSDNVGIAMCNLIFPLGSLKFFSLIALRMFWHTTVICVPYSDLKKLLSAKNGINSWTFSCDYFSQHSTWIITTCIDEP